MKIEIEHPSFGEAVQDVAEETRGQSPALKIKRAAIAAHHLAQAIEALEESLDGAAWLSEETKADAVDLAETFKAIGHDGEYLAERFGDE